MCETVPERRHKTFKPRKLHFSKCRLRHLLRRFNRRIHSIIWMFNNINFAKILNLSKAVYDDVCASNAAADNHQYLEFLETSLFK